MTYYFQTLFYIPTCSDRSAFVTWGFIRVSGVEGEVHGCPHCLTNRELSEGDAAARGE